MCESESGDEEGVGDGSMSKIVGWDEWESEEGR